MNCTCGKCNVCLAANPASFGTPVYNAGVPQPNMQMAQPQMQPRIPTFEEYQAGMGTLPIVPAAAVGAAPAMGAGAATPIMEQGGATPTVDEFVFVDMSIWEILFPTLPDPQGLANGGEKPEASLSTTVTPSVQTTPIPTV